MSISRNPNSKRQNAKGFFKTYTDAIASNIRIAVLDNKCTITWVNDKFCNLIRYEEYELLGKPLSELNLVSIHADDFKTIQTIISAGRPWSGEIKSRTKQGSILWVKTNILPIMDSKEKVGSYLILCTNITSTKTALEEKEKVMGTLTRSEARYRALVENQPDLMSLCNADGVRLFVNAKYCEFMGKAERDLIGTSIIELPFGGLSLEVIKKIYTMTPQNKEVSGVFQLENSSREKVWVSLFVRGIFDTQGKLFEILTIGRDVTDLKKAEFRLSKYVEDLERIAFMTSHKVRAPIATMLGLVELLRLNAIHSNQWGTVFTSFDKCINDLDLYSKELGAFINQRQSVKKEDL
jgi:two-component system sensor histidine kinase NreB